MTGPGLSCRQAMKGHMHHREVVNPSDNLLPQVQNSWQDWHNINAQTTRQEVHVRPCCKLAVGPCLLHWQTLHNLVNFAGDELELKTFQLLMDILGAMSISQASMAAAASAGRPALRRSMKHTKMGTWLAASAQGLHALPEWQLAQQQRSLEDKLFCPGPPIKMKHGEGPAASGSYVGNDMYLVRDKRIQAGFHGHLLRGQVPEVQPWRHIQGVASLRRPPLEYPCTILVNPQGLSAAWQQPGCATDRLLAWAKHMPSASVTIHLFLGHFNVQPAQTTQVFRLRDFEALHHTIPKYALVGLVDAMDGMPAAEEALQRSSEEHWQQQRLEGHSRHIRPCQIVESMRLVYSDDGVEAPSALLGCVQVHHLPSCKQSDKPVSDHIFNIPLDWSQGPPRGRYGDLVLTFDKEYQDLGEREKGLVRQLYDQHHSSSRESSPSGTITVQLASCGSAILIVGAEHLSPQQPTQPSCGCTASKAAVPSPAACPTCAAQNDRQRPAADGSPAESHDRQEQAGLPAAGHMLHQGAAASFDGSAQVALDASAASARPPSYVSADPAEIIVDTSTDHAAAAAPPQISSIASPQVAADGRPGSPMAEAATLLNFPAESDQAATDRMPAPASYTQGSCNSAQVALEKEPGSRAVSARAHAEPAEPGLVALDMSPGKPAATSDETCDFVLETGARKSLLWVVHSAKAFVHGPGQLVPGADTPEIKPDLQKQGLGQLTP